ncbi:phosphate-starvation-inducible protein PsiE [Qipengyuania sp. ASV99]|uniref:phosphate-starvation-inducible protein PsiE n=1 Tax=Qipengyuania sp. ASV99 TaxID=3399681 RepID=UPI003A4C74F6
MADPQPVTDHPTVPTDRQTNAGRAFVLVERLLLVLVAGMTVFAAGAEVVSVYQRSEINLADILLMFLYTEVIGMIAVYYTGKGTFFIYPIFIAITAIARLIVLQGKDMAPENVLYEAGAILLLSVAALVLSRAKAD